MTPPAASLMEEVIEEILLRCPPDEPASLFRAALVCKPWCRLISDPRFRSRYREFHRSPPLLGFLCGGYDRYDDHIARFVPTAAFSSPVRRGRLVDARHGRVLLKREAKDGTGRVLEVWDPVTDEQWEIPKPYVSGSLRTWNATVLCAAGGAGAGAGACNHLDCHGRAFLVVFVASCSTETVIWTYSSDAGSWSDPICTQQHDEYVGFFFPSMLVGNALYFELRSRKRILKYDLESHEFSVVGLPPSTSFFRQPVVLTTTEDGRLGLATIHKSKLYIWSRKDDAEWTHDRVIELETLLSSTAIRTEPVLVGFVDRFGVILLRAGAALFTVDLKTSKLKKVCDDGSIHTVVPYMSFCTPALGGGLRGEGPSAGASGA